MLLQPCNNCAPTLGAFTPPADCQSGYFVTDRRWEADGRQQLYINGVPSTEADLQALTAWQNACRAEMQRVADQEAAKRALELASQPITPGLFTFGPGSSVDQAPGVTLAVKYTESIVDPVLRHQTASSVVNAVQQNPTNPGAVTVTTPDGQIVTIGRGSATPGVVPPPGSYVSTGDGGYAVVQPFPDQSGGGVGPVQAEIGAKTLLALAAAALLLFR